MIAASSFEDRLSTASLNAAIFTIYIA